MNFVKNYSLTRNEYFKFNLRNIKRQSILYSILAAVLAFLLALFKKDMDTSVLSKIDFWLVYLLFVVIGVAIVNLYLITMVFLGAKLVYKNNKVSVELITSSHYLTKLDTDEEFIYNQFVRMYWNKEESKSTP